MKDAAAGRMPWHDVAEPVRDAVARILGSPVVDAETQPGGFSPGSADRVRCADGTRAFVKTAWAEVNLESTRIHRREAAIDSLLPSSVPRPQLRGSADLGDWVVLVFEDIDGRMPAVPWREAELIAVLDALADIGDVVIPEGRGIGSLPDALRHEFGGWGRVRSVEELELTSADRGWVEDDLPTLVADSARALDDLRGDRLAHLDVRADNVLLTPGGAAMLIDWPWAARGAPWFDALALMVNVRLYDPGYDVRRLMRSHPAFRDMADPAAGRALAALAGYFLEGATQPAKPGLPTLRRFQHDQGIAALTLLRECR